VRDGWYLDCGYCGETFVVCRHCAGNRKYCSKRCAKLVRAEQQRLARKCHQESPEGRLDHRDRNRSYRARRRERERKRVMDTTSEELASSGNLCLAPPSQEQAHASDGDHDHGDGERDPSTGPGSGRRSANCEVASPLNQPSVGAEDPCWRRWPCGARPHCALCCL
jgi:hypothetical protein